MDDLSALPYLDAFVRETLRVHSPVPNAARVAMKDDVIPLDIPFVDKNGVTQHAIRYALSRFASWKLNSNAFHRVTKGDHIVIPILALNRSEDIWGKDATTFRYPSHFFTASSIFTHSCDLKTRAVGVDPP